MLCSECNEREISQGYKTVCKRCYQRLWKRKNYDLELDWKRKLKYYYNISAKEYYDLLEEQDGGCAICGKSPEDNGKKLYVDHDHSCCPTKKKSCGMCIRGLLCGNCNSGLGFFMDKAELLIQAAEYLGA